nr:reverse transcriptase domain, reverse transcriptase zinc-binding domain protein [Tanacetum cinerariifolium]
MSISHLMYADDVIFFGEWSWVNTQNLISMIRCFFLISGLKINVHKSNVLGVGVADEEISHMAHIIGCGVSNLLFKYLGVPVGCNMSRCANWNAVTQIFASKLSCWKARLLSVGGRLSLIKAVLGNLPTYFMSIYPMPVSIRSKLESMRSKLFRGADQNDNKMSWVKWERCLASMKKGGIAGQRNCLILLQSVWSTVLRRIPRRGVESAQLDALKVAIGNVSLTDQYESWQWSLGVAAGFSVACVRTLVDDTTLKASLVATSWIRNTPIKVNVFIWRLSLNKLPSMVNLDRRAIELSGGSWIFRFALTSRIGYLRVAAAGTL